jgi:hypothetical protein
LGEVLHEEGVVLDDGLGENDGLREVIVPK